MTSFCCKLDQLVRSHFPLFFSRIVYNGLSSLPLRGPCSKIINRIPTYPYDFTKSTPTTCHACFAKTFRQHVPHFAVALQVVQQLFLRISSALLPDSYSCALRFPWHVLVSNLLGTSPQTLSRCSPTIQLFVCPSRTASSAAPARIFVQCNHRSSRSRFVGFVIV